MNARFLDALKGENCGIPPIWLMRQAGRYMSSYRALRNKYSFLEMCHRSDLIAEVTLLPLDAFDFDAAILFSDILVIFDCFGIPIRFDEGVGPIIENPVQTNEDIRQLQAKEIDAYLGEVFKGISYLRTILKVPLIGFSGAPFTLATYLIEGKTGRNFKKTKQWMIKNPESFHLLLEKLTDLVIEYLKKQIQSGIQAIQLFDSWANILSPSHFRTFSLFYMQKIVEALKPYKIPLIIFCRGSSLYAEMLADIKPSCISVDWNGDLQKIRRKIPWITLQGNLDPDILYASPHVIRKEVSEMLRSMQGDPSYIFNLGHGIAPDTPEDAVKVLVESVRVGVVE